jgi:molybdenum cofactor cytidylyltransferase
MQLARAFRIRSKEVIAFVGGGGKTAAMFRLARELAAQGKRVITTTTTRLAASQIRHAPKHLVYDWSVDFPVRACETLARHPHLLVIGNETEEGKALGVPPALVDELIALDDVDAVIVEADGARTRPFKAPGEHEPVIPGSTTLLVPVIGVRALGGKIDDTHTHRAEIVARLAGARVGEAITPNVAARVLTHAEGGMKHRPRDARAIALINQVESDAQIETARALARLLLGYGEIDAVALGAAQREDAVREIHRRVAVVVLAGGAGTRMGDQVKQLLEWRGATLLENALAVAMQASAHQVIVVLGARGDELRLKLHRTTAQIILNRDWETGHASSIRAGVRAIPPPIDAVVFLNADQPFVSADVLDRVIQRHRETDAPIVVASFAGRRGSPGLFDRAHFDELMTLEGEQGGRELLFRHAEQVETVLFDDARLGFDIDTPEDYALALIM